MSDHDPVEGAYSAIADAQLDELEAADPALYDDVLTMCEFIFTQPDRAQSMSTAIRTEHGIRLRLAVPGRHPLKIFWSTDEPRVEAVFPHP